MKKFPLIDGPLAPRPLSAMTPTERLVAAMASDLVHLGATASERDAIRALTACGYRMGDVALLAEDALIAARQSAVASVMAQRR
jgi:hypothetical protein